MKLISHTLIALASLGVSADDRGEAGVEDLQGTWTVTRMTERGEVLPPGSGMELRIDRNRIVTTRPDGSMAEGTIQADPTRSPRLINLNYDTSFTKGKPIRGLYRRSGRSLTLVLAAPGADRPTEFVSTHESGTSLILLTRSEPEPNR